MVDRSMAPTAEDAGAGVRVLRIELDSPDPAFERTRGAQLGDGTRSSGTEAVELPWQSVLEQASAEGYTSVSVVARRSPPQNLGEILGGARQLGMVTSLHVGPEWVASIALPDAELVQHWILRMIGPGERAANSLRMGVMLSALSSLSALNARASLSFQLDATNLDDLPWAAWLAAEQAVSSLTVETAQTGARSAPGAPQPQLDVSQRVWAMLVLARARQRYPSLQYEIDLSDVNLVRREPGRLLAGSAAPSEDRPLAEVVAPLVIDASGKVSPLLSTLSSKLALGNLKDASLTELARHWKVHSGQAFMRFCRQVHADVCENLALPFFNWAEHLQLQSRKMDAIVPRSIEATVSAKPGAVAAPTPLDAPPRWAPMRPHASLLPELPWGAPHSARAYRSEPRAPSPAR